MRIDKQGVSNQLGSMRATTIEEQLSRMEQLQRDEYLKPKPAVKADWQRTQPEPTRLGQPQAHSPGASSPQVEIPVNRAAAIQAYKDGMKLPETVAVEKVEKNPGTK